MANRALVVDDNPAARLVVRSYLETLDWEVVAETDTQAATLAAYDLHKPDVVLLDLALAGENGRLILRELRKIDASAKVIIVTANSQKTLVKQLMEEGAAAYLTKPFDIPEFKEAIEKASR